MPFESGDQWTGNEKGRPPGSGYRQKIFNELVLPHKEALIEKALSLAKDGDSHMLRLFLERMLPTKPKDEAVSFDLPVGAINNKEIINLGKEILRSLGAGEITPSEAKASFDAIRGYWEHSAVEELQKQLDEIKITLDHQKNATWMRKPVVKQVDDAL